MTVPKHPHSQSRASAPDPLGQAEHRGEKLPRRQTAVQPGRPHVRRVATCSACLNVGSSRSIHLRARTPESLSKTRRFVDMTLLALFNILWVGGTVSNHTVW